MCCDAASGVSQDALTWTAFSCLGCWQLWTRSLKMLCCHGEPNVGKVSRFWWEKSFFYPQSFLRSKWNLFFIRSPSLPGPLPPSSPSSRSLSVLCLSSFSGMCSVCVWPKTTLSLSLLPFTHHPRPLLCVIGSSAWMFGSRVTPSQWGLRGPLSLTHARTETHLKRCIYNWFCVCVGEYWIVVWPCMQHLHYPAEFNSLCKNFPTHRLSYFHRTYARVYL